MMEMVELEPKSPNYPFSAIVGQEQAKRALLLSAVNPAIGGVLLCGPGGSGKSLLLHAASSMIHDRQPISIPVNITPDRLKSSIDITSTMKQGTLVRNPGLLEHADGQLVLVDHMNLLSGALMKEIVNASSRGAIRRFMLLAGMDVKDGAIGPSLLDHFGICVALEELKDPMSRAEIIRRRLRFEQDSYSFTQPYQPLEDALRERINTANQSLSRIEVSTEMIQLAASIVQEAGIASARAGLALIEAAKAEAAWRGRNQVTIEDIREMAGFVLPHRMREAVDKQNVSHDSPHEAHASNRDSPQSNHADSSRSSSQLSDQTVQRQILDCQGNAFNQHRQEMPEQDWHKDTPNGSENGIEERVALPDETFRIEPLKLHRKQKLDETGLGKRNDSRAVQRKGRTVGAILPGGKSLADVAFDATIRAAAPYQVVRTPKNGVVFAIEADDLRLKKRENRVGATLLFVVDASGSMAARKRMEMVKGGILSLLRDAYVKRDRIGMIAFRKEGAEVVLPVTRSIDMASKHLRDIPTGGKTPLAAALIEAYKVLQAEKRRNEGTVPILILVTDGKANHSASGLTASSDVWKECLEAARGIRLAGISCLVIDTEQGYVRLGRSKQLAEDLGAEYRELEDLHEEEFANLVRTTRG